MGSRKKHRANHRLCAKAAVRGRWPDTACGRRLKAAGRNGQAPFSGQAQVSRSGGGSEAAEPAFEGFVIGHCGGQRHEEPDDTDEEARQSIQLYRGEYCTYNKKRSEADIEYP